MSDIADKARDAVQAKLREPKMQEYIRLINDTPALTSLMYDSDLLPEQIMCHVDINRMIAVCELFKRLTKEQADSLFSK